MTTPTSYPVVLEPTDTGYSVFVPDLPGCVSTGTDRADALAMIAEAIAFHLEGMRKDGEAIPAPGGAVAWVDVQAA